jgi:hypothetical protein
MATDTVAVEAEDLELRQALASMQRSLDQLQQQHGLLLQAILNIVRGRWDAAQFGTQSVESDLVALNPALHGKVNAVPFALGRS